jgi:putative transposase
MVRQSIKIYNELRPHLSLKYKTPDAVHQALLNQLKVGK